MGFKSSGPKEVSYILRRTRVKALVTADAFGHLDFVANLDTMRPDLPELEWAAVVGDDPGPEPALRRARCRRADRGTAPGRPVRPCADRVHVGNDVRPEGGDALPSHHRRRDPPARCNTASRAVGAGWRAGRPRHRDARRAVASGVPAPVGASHRRLGPGARARGDARRRLVVRPGRDVLPHQPARPSRLRCRAACRAHAGDRTRRFRGPAAVGERAEQLGIKTMRSFGSTEHPSITGCTAESPREKRLFTDGAPLPGRRAANCRRGRPRHRAGRAGRDLEPRARMLRRLHRPRAHRRRVRARRLVHDGRRRRARCRRVPRDHRSQEGHHHPRRRERERGRSRGAARAHAGRRRGRSGRGAGSAARRARRARSSACRPATTAPDLATVRTHLEQRGLARQKWPEDVRAITDFPRTPSGKIQKYVLRQWLREEAPTA